MADRSNAPRPRFRIDALHVRVPGDDAEHGARLGRQVAERLSAADVEGVSGRFERVSVRVASPGGGDDALAGSVTHAVLRALRRG